MLSIKKYLKKKKDFHSVCNIICTEKSSLIGAAVSRDSCFYVAFKSEVTWGRFDGATYFPDLCHKQRAVPYMTAFILFFFKHDFLAISLFLRDL